MNKSEYDTLVNHFEKMFNGKYVRFCNNDISLDGDFTSSELRQIADMMDMLSLLLERVA